MYYIIDIIINIILNIVIRITNNNLINEPYITNQNVRDWFFAFQYYLA